jgi:hypothetical protein
MIGGNHGALVPLLPSLITDGLLIGIEREGGWSSGLKRGNKLKAVQLDT